MKEILLLVCVSADLALARTPSPQIKREASSAQDLVPQNWKLIFETRGDLNKDGREDIVAVIEGSEKQKSVAKDEDEMSAPPRTLIVAFQNKKGSFVLSTQADHAIRLADYGGISGSDFDEPTIEKGILVIHQFWGTAVNKDTSTYRFRFQNGDWYLIGATIDSMNLIKDPKGNVQDNSDDAFEKWDSKSMDYNLSTGRLITTASKGKTSAKSIGKKKILLKDFNYENTDFIFK